MGKDYNIAKTNGMCCSCERQLQPGEKFVATIIAGEENFAREDFCIACWEAKGPGEQATAGRFGVWRSCVPQPQEKKKLFVDDDLLVNFFERLADAEDQAKISFRFVLALVLMRKKLLVYDRADKGSDGLDVWTMHFKGSDTKHRVIDPDLDEDRIAEVSQHLGEILEGEL